MSRIESEPERKDEGERGITWPGGESQDVRDAYDNR